MSLTISLIGLDALGMSLGLALKASGYPITVVAHDREPTLSDQAVKLGAADRRDWNLFGAIEGADLVILNEPFAQLRDTMGLIASDLRPDAVLTDTLSLKGAVMAAARELLPPTVHFVGGAPLVSADTPSATLFQKQRYALLPAPEAAEAAVRLVTNMVTLLGAEPLFMEPEEHDALRGAVEQLPLLLGAALLQMTTSSNGWREMSMMAGRAFAHATSANVSDPSQQVEMMHSNRAAIRHWLASYRRELDALAARFDEESPEALGEHLAALAEARARWDAQRGSPGDEALAKALDTAKENNKTVTRWFGLGRKR